MPTNLRVTLISPSGHVNITLCHVINTHFREYLLSIPPYTTSKLFYVASAGFEPATFALSTHYSTTELTGNC